jgi:outer membrane lipoprotein LolB
MEYRLAALLLAALAVSACTQLGSVSKPVDAPLSQRQLLELNAWELRGRLAYKDAHGAGGQASLRWWQTGESSRLRVAGPFGAGAYELTVAPDEVRIRDGQAERSLAYAGPDALEQLLREQLGWYFPAAAARYWVLGVADPAVPATAVRDADGRMAALEQHGWRITYQRFAEFDGAMLPVKLRMESVRAELRVVVSRWSLAASQ